MAGKPKLHELIAVEGELQGTARKILEETKTTFDKKADHFLAHRKQVKMLAATAEAQAEELSEETAIDTTVSEKLDHMQGALVRWLDAVAQKERTNQDARADLVVDGQVILKDAPATFLLGLEDKFKAIRAVYEEIPTLAPGRTWLPDAGHAKKGVYKVSPDEVKIRTKKVAKPVVLYEATKEHPAQVKEMTEDVTVGTITTEHWSGMISPAEKSDLLERIDKLIRAVKKARQRANSVDIVKINVGRALFAFIDGKTVSAAAGSEVAEAD
jgi:hypothetical protein